MWKCPYIFTEHFIARNTCTRLRQRRIPRRVSSPVVWFLLRVFINLVVIGLLAGSGYLVWYISATQSLSVSSHSTIHVGLLHVYNVDSVISSAKYAFLYISILLPFQNNLSLLSDLALPLCISAINFILPFAFSHPWCIWEVQES